ncbi:MAG: hypothetical protein ACP5HK_07575 [Acidilobus sp.]
MLGAIIGSGWLFGSFYAAAMAVPAAIVSWIIAGVLLLFVALAFAELSGAIPNTGAIIRYPQYSHGSFAPTLRWALFMVLYSGWALIVSFISLTTVLTYIIGGSDLMVLRRTAPQHPEALQAEE